MTMSSSVSARTYIANKRGPALCGDLYSCETNSTFVILWLYMVQGALGREFPHGMEKAPNRRRRRLRRLHMGSCIRKFMRYYRSERSRAAKEKGLQRRRERAQARQLRQQIADEDDRRMERQRAHRLLQWLRRENEREPPSEPTPTEAALSPTESAFNPSPTADNPEDSEAVLSTTEEIEI